MGNVMIGEEGESHAADEEIVAMADRFLEQESGYVIKYGTHLPTILQGFALLLIN